MARELPHLALCCALATLVACDAGAIFTDIDLILPAGDGDALRTLTRIEIEVWSPSVGACLGLQTWALAACSADECGPPWRPPGEPMAAISLGRGDAGLFGSTDLSVPGDGPWQILVRGFAADGDAFLSGCQVTADAGERVRVLMFRPWCDPRACASQFHAACNPTIDCSMIGDLATAENPPCTSAMLGLEVRTWEENGVSCVPDDGGEYVGTCRQAAVLCNPGLLDPIVDGTCPNRDVVEGCGDPDLDCNGRRPGSCERDCRTAPVTPADCGDSGCYDDPVCNADGTFDCVLRADGGSEVCGGGDEDCDGRPDAEDPDAISECNDRLGRSAANPAANECVGGTCRCGATDACTGGGANVCCAGTCANLQTSATNCGACGRGCTGDCIDGSCINERCTVAACNQGRSPSRPRADGCSTTELPVCLCGGETACIGGDVCCDGACRANCGADSDAGVLCVPEVEACDGRDGDCDGILDDTDSDAVAACNVEGLFADGCTRAGICTCDDGLACTRGTCCRGVGCRNTNDDPRNCGACGRNCADGETCVAGACRT